jgi:hypothetical protein
MCSAIDNHTFDRRSDLETRDVQQVSDSGSRLLAANCILGRGREQAYS